MRTVRSGVVVGAAAQLVLLAVLAGSVGLGPAGWAAGLAYGAGLFGFLAYALDRRRRTRLGPANVITLLRAVLVGGVAALVAASFTGPAALAALVPLASVALALDAVDGPVARRTGTVSTLGARFDMEVDALLIGALSVFAARPFGAFVLLIGAARYLYVAAGWAWPWLRAAAPARYWCKVVAAVQGIVLTVAAANVLPWWVAEAAIVLALVLLAESFGREAWWLWWHRAPAPATPARVLVPHG